MPVPELDQIRLPALQFLNDGQLHHIRDLYEGLVAEFDLSEQDQNELLPKWNPTTLA